MKITLRQNWLNLLIKLKDYKRKWCLIKFLSNGIKIDKEIIPIYFKHLFIFSNNIQQILKYYHSVF